MFLTVKIFMDYVWSIEHGTWSMEKLFTSNKLISLAFLYWFHSGFCKCYFIFQYANPVNLVFLLVASIFSINLSHQYNLIIPFYSLEE